MYVHPSLTQRQCFITDHPRLRRARTLMFGTRAPDDASVRHIDHERHLRRRRRQRRVFKPSSVYSDTFSTRDHHVVEVVDVSSSSSPANGVANTQFVALYTKKTNERNETTSLGWLLAGLAVG